MSGNASPDEIHELNNWVSESEANKEYFNNIRIAWLVSPQIDINLRFNASKGLDKIHQKIDKRRDYQKVRNLNGSKYFISNKILKIAAIFFIVFLSGVITSYYILKNSSDSSICYIEAPLGSRVSAGLPDGSQVWLNAGSKLEYNTNYNRNNREVHLTGEGFFKVKTNPNKPFIVKTREISVKAVGTAFNVKAYPDEKQVTTTLVEGKVQLEGKGENNKTFSYSLSPNQKATYYKDEKLFDNIKKTVEKPKPAEKREIEKEIIPLKEVAPIVSNINVNTELYTSWKDERWIIQTENLEDLAVLLERRFNVKLTFKNEELKKYRFSGTIQNETLEQIFDIMRYVIDKGKVTLDMDKTLKNKYRAAYLN